MLPVLPVGPEGPVAPVAPVTPVGPRAPVGPPDGPAGPVGPTVPPPSPRRTPEDRLPIILAMFYSIYYLENKNMSEKLSPLHHLHTPQRDWKAHMHKQSLQHLHPRVGDCHDCVVFQSGVLEVWVGGCPSLPVVGYVFEV